MYAMHEQVHSHPQKPCGSGPERSHEEKPQATPCQRHNDPELWFAQGPADVEKAKQLCSDCPMKVACLGSALDRGEPWGVWGGELLVSGAVVAKKRGRGRPRKAAVAAA